ncbi:MAG: hypothetical protein R3A10_05825 [Caldilineaceae bacterium]
MDGRRALCAGRAVPGSAGHRLGRALLETALAQAHAINSAIWINFASLWLAGAQRLQGDYDAADATPCVSCCRPTRPWRHWRK